MPIETDFTFHHEHAARHALAHAAPAPADFLGHLRGFVGGRPGAQNQRTWKGAGFNMIWRPTSAAGSGAQGFFLELNLTDETLSFNEISGNTGVANRGLLQQDIFLGAVAYVQTIKDTFDNSGQHFEPGVWRVCLTRPIPAKSHPWSGWVQFRMARRSICRGRRFRSQCRISLFPASLHSKLVVPMTGYKTRPFPRRDPYERQYVPYGSRPSRRPDARSAQQSKPVPVASNRRSDRP
jgi:hypothetical protein